MAQRHRRGQSLTGPASGAFICPADRQITAATLPIRPDVSADPCRTPCTHSASLLTLAAVREEGIDALGLDEHRSAAGMVLSFVEYTPKHEPGRAAAYL